MGTTKETLNLRHGETCDQSPREVVPGRSSRPAWTTVEHIQKPKGGGGTTLPHPRTHGGPSSLLPALSQHCLVLSTLQGPSHLYKPQSKL